MAWPQFSPVLLNRARPQTPITRAFLDLDSGALVEPSDYPYRTRGPVPAFGNRIALPLGNARADRQLFPPTGLLGRSLAHLAYRGQRRTGHGATQDISGNRDKAHGLYTRPWLFGGSDIVRAAPRTSSVTPKAPCSGC